LDRLERQGAVFTAVGSEYIGESGGRMNLVVGLFIATIDRRILEAKYRVTFQRESPSRDRWRLKEIFPLGVNRTTDAVFESKTSGLLADQVKEMQDVVVSRLKSWRDKAAGGNDYISTISESGVTLKDFRVIGVRSVKNCFLPGPNPAVGEFTVEMTFRRSGSSEFITEQRIVKLGHGDKLEWIISGIASP